METVAVYIENGEVVVPTLFGNKPIVAEYIRHILEIRGLVLVDMDLSLLDTAETEYVTVARYYKHLSTFEESSPDSEAFEPVAINGTTKPVVEPVTINGTTKPVEKKFADKNKLMELYEDGYNDIDSLMQELQREGYYNKKFDIELFLKSMSEVTSTFEESDFEPVKTSKQLGIDGELQIYQLLQKLFPKFVVEQKGNVAHSADIHMTDDKHKIRYVFEVKNKTALTGEDINKFERDLDTLRCDKYRIIGIFISIRSNIPIYGECNIQSDRCYLSSSYCTEENIKLIVEVYDRLLKPLPKAEKVEYIIPENIKQLLMQLKSEYKTIDSQKDMYLQQIKFNNESNEMMHSLLSKVELQKHFINFINKEFLDVLDVEDVAEVVKEDEETRLREYLSSKSASSIRKKDILEEFPNMDKLKTMLLKDIIAEYRK